MEQLPLYDVGVPDDVVWVVNRVETTFGNPATPALAHIKKIGTGFWLRNRQGARAFILNKHSIDPLLAFQHPGERSLVQLRIELRQLIIRDDGSLTAYDPTKFFRVANLSRSLVVHDTADCAALIAPSFVDPAAEFQSIELRLSSLADADCLSHHAKLMDLASFIGYPGDPPLWDERSTTPIARLCSLASLPGQAFTNARITTSDSALVSGLSFGGSSGSPLWHHSTRGQEPKVLGIMSGHANVGDGPAIHHSGLSWYTRATSIRHLLSHHGFQ